MNALQALCVAISPCYSISKRSRRDRYEVLLANESPPQDCCGLSSGAFTSKAAVGLSSSLD